MAIEIGERIPNVKLKTQGDEGVRDVQTADLFRGKRAVLFAVPGAFTPTCSDHHLPGFVTHAQEILAKVDLLACVAVNDVFVMTAWGKVRGVGDRIQMLADGNGDLAKAMGLEMDASAYGMGVRSRRYVALLEDGVIKKLHVEQPGKLEVSTAESILAEL